MDKDIKVEPVHHYGFNLYNRHGKLIATAPQVDGLFVLYQVLDRAPGSTEYTDIDDSCLLALDTNGPASRQDAAKWMLWHHRLAQVSHRAWEIMPTVVADSPKITGKCDCDSCIKCELARKPSTPNTTSPATEPLQIIHTDICSPLGTAIGGGRYMLLFIDGATKD
jgi:hypothetical protein